MQPRLADDRVGHFLDAVKDFSRDQAIDPYVRYVNRWRLEPSDLEAFAAGELVEPKEPIVFYIDRSVPTEYRRYVKEGIEGWQKAFEGAGFKRAIIAKEAPTVEEDSTWSAEDARYSTVRWTAAHQMGYAIGPSQTDPRTGEILNADILISSGFVRGWLRDWQELTPEAMDAALRPDLAKAPAFADVHDHALCYAEHGKAQQLSLQHTILQATGRLPGGEPMPESYLGDAIRDLTLHEVGHTIGLRHNFKASSGIPYDRLHDMAFTTENGVSLSVMDYAPVNIALNADEQGHYWNKEAGTYDVWAITYAYRPALLDDGTLAATPEAELPVLKAIADQSSDPLHTYGTDEDNWLGAFAVDPLTNAWELGSDPLRFATDRSQLVNGILPTIDDRLVAEGERYYRLRSVTASLIFERYRALLPVTKTVGGMLVSRDRKGAPDARMPFTPLAADRQRAAMDLIVREAFAPEAFAFDADLLNKLAPNRYRDWGTGWSMQVDFPIHQYVEIVQGGLMQELLHPARLQRMIDNEMRAGSTPAYRPSEMMQALTGAVWAELDDAPRRVAATNSFRRNLQRMYADHLVRLMMDAPAWRMYSRGGVQQLETPEHVRSLARLELTDLSDRLGAALANGNVDRDAQAHLSETKTRIDRALDAAMMQVVEP
jgi:hypothetical protein